MDPPLGELDVRETTVILGDRPHLPARVFIGGTGDAVVLVHGGWGGAATHWSSVWGELAKRHRVIAPDLPGVGDVSQPALGSVAAYARWLHDVLFALGVDRAWLVGNSFGVSVICRFAFDSPDRCRGLVFVNGFAMPRVPPILQKFGDSPVGRRLVKQIERRIAYTPGAVERAFFDRGKIPDEVRRVVSEPSSPQLDALTDALVQGGGPPRPYPVAPVLLFGEDDGLPGTTKRSARRLEARLPGAKLAFVPRAGHMPQIENPRAFVDTLEPLLAA